MRIQRIVAGVGNLDGGAETLHWAVGVLGSRCEVMVVHVAPEECGADDRATARSRLEEMTRSLGVRTTEVEVGEGGVAAYLANAAQRFRADVVVVGQPRARPALDSLRADPVAELFHLSPVPVLVGRPGATTEVRRVTAAVDESELRDGVFLATRVVRAHTRAEVAVAYVLDSVPYNRVREAAWMSLRGEDAMTQFTQEVHRGLRRNGLPWSGEEIYVSEGGRANRIVEAAERTRADLLVMGSCGPGRWRRLFAGSAALAVARHARCPVLVVSEHQQPAVRQLRNRSLIRVRRVPRLRPQTRLRPGRPYWAPTDSR